MHELSIAISLVEAICDELPALGSPSVRTVHLRVGPRSGVVPEALSFSFDLAAAGTPVEGATLAIERTPDGADLELVSLEVIDEAANSRGPQERPEEE